EVQEASRPRWLAVSLPLTLLNQRGEGPPPWPAAEQVVSFADLAERAYLDATNADNAVKRNQWERLTALAADLAKIAQALPGAANPPETYSKKGLEGLAKEMLGRTEVVQAAVAGKDRTGTGNALRR